MRVRIASRRLVLLMVAALLVRIGMAAAQDAPRATGGDAQAQGGAPQVVSYQGQVTVGGTVYSGPGHFKFAVVNQAGNTTYWSNDGTSAGGGQPVDAVSLTVSTGLFNVLLGDTTLEHMAALPASAFAGTDRWLRVWFSSDGSTFVQLSPDRRIAAVPYALQAEDAGTLDGLHASALQLRISGSCAAGSTIRAVNADGTIDCEEHDSRPVFSVTAVHTDANARAGTSVTIGADGLPVVSYQVRDSVNADYDLNVLHCGNISCTAGNTVTTADPGGKVGDDTSITVGADGLPVVAYSDRVDYDLKVLHCGNVACTAGNTITAVDSSDSVGEYPSITIGSDGLPVISYYDDTHGQLKVAHCGDAACSAGNSLTTISPFSPEGHYGSITTGADGLPVISYFHWGDADLKVLHCGNAACTAGNTETVVDSAQNVGLWTSITIGRDSLPVISYFDTTSYDLKVLHCGNVTCTSGNTATTVDSTGNVGQYSSITIGADGLPAIAYQDVTNDDLKVLHCGNAACSANNTVTTVQSSGFVGAFTSITIGTDGLPLVTTVESPDLRVAHCSNVFCVPYWRPR